MNKKARRLTQVLLIIVLSVMMIAPFISFGEVFSEVKFFTEALDAGGETVLVDSTLGDGNSHDVDLASISSYNITVDITGQTLDDPRLVISIPKGIALSYYPTKNDATLSSNLAGLPEPVTKITDSDGNTILTYFFKSNVAAIGFNITLDPTYKLKPGSTYIVSAVLNNDDITISQADDSITVINNPTLNLAAYKGYEYNESVLISEDADYYYSRLNGYIVSNYSNPYEYDRLQIVLPLPDQSEPGYYDNDTFVLLNEGISKNIPYGTVNYDSAYDIADRSGNLIAENKKVLIYDLFPEHSLVDSNYTSYHYYYNTNMGGIFVRFPGNTIAGTYSSSAGACVQAYIDGDTQAPIVLKDFSGSNVVSYTFKTFNIKDYFYQYMSNSYSNVYTSNNILNIQDNNYYYSYFYNKTGEVLEDIRVEYTIPEEINNSKLKFNLTSIIDSHYPTSAHVSFRTKNDATLKTVTMTADDNILTLSDPDDCFTYLDVVYDRLGVYDYSTVLMYGYVNNPNNIEEGSTYYIVSAKILSATPTGSISDVTIGEQNTYFTIFYLKQSYSIMPPYDYYLSKSSLSKGDDFEISFRLTDNYSFVTNPSIYLLMPSEFIFAGYTTPFQGSEYDIRQREILVTEDKETVKVPAGKYTLYTVEYNDGIAYKSDYNLHKMKFTVGPLVDTATLKSGVHLPCELAFSNANIQFPYYLDNSGYTMTDTWDFDEDGNTTEKLSSPYSHPTVTINAVRSIFAQSYVTSSYSGSGESINQNYQHNSSGSYKLYINNGLESGNTATDSVISIKVPKKDFSSEENTSQWDVDLTSAPSLTGEFLSGASISYSIDGGNTYQETIYDYSLITDIKIRTQAGIFLQSSESAIVELPFNASFPSQGIDSYSKAYFESDFAFYLNDSLNKVEANIKDNILSTVPVTASGAIFKDYDSDGIQDDTEMSNYKNYHLYLYKGEYSEGTNGLTYLGSEYTNYYTGSYAFNNIFLPGTYTLRVQKSNDEYFPSGGSFIPENGTNYAYYTFTIDETTEDLSNISLGIISPRTLNLNFSSITLLKDGISRKIVPTVNPALDQSETATFVSSDESVVMVSADGTLTYAGDGDAFITVTVPQVSSLTDIFGEDPVTKTVNVKARKTEYNIYYKDHNSNDIDSSLPDEYANFKSYVYDRYTILPTVEPYSRTGYTFTGWYSESTRGYRISYFYYDSYGDTDLYARWNANTYNITYYGMSGASYGVLHPFTHTYDSPTTISNPTKAGYKFVGWSINSGITPVKDLVLSKNAYTSDITLEAKWSLLEPDISISTDAEGDQVIYGTDLTITAIASHPIDPEYSYAWYKHNMDDSVTYVGTNDSQLILSQVLESGDYLCEVSMSDGIDTVTKISDIITVNILKAEGSITKISDISKKYDGETALEPEFIKEGTGSAIVYYKEASEDDSAYSTARPKEAGDFILKIHVEEDSNFKKVTQTKNFTISRRIITLTPDDLQGKIYGNEDLDLTYSSDADLVAVTGETPVIEGNVTRVSGEDAGTYIIGLGTLKLSDGINGNSFKAQNYKLILDNEPVYFNISKREIEITADSNEKIYDGTDLTDNGYKITSNLGFPVGEGFDYVTVQGSRLFVGSSPNTITMYEFDENTDADNYIVITKQGTLTINKASIPLVLVPDSAEKTYDGTPLTAQNFSYVGQLASGDSPDVQLSGSLTDHGFTSSSIKNVKIFHGDVDVTDNYDIATTPGVLSINRRHVEILAKDAEKRYDGTQLLPDGYTIGGDGFAEGEGLDSVDLTGSRLFPGSSQITLDGYTLLENTKADNYVITYEQGTLTVNTASIPLKITADSSEKTYDGTALTASGHTLEGELAAGDTQTVLTEGSITDFGTVSNIVKSVKIFHGDVDVTENYVITVKFGLLEIFPQQYEDEMFEISSVSSFEYSGIEIEPEIKISSGGDTLIFGKDYLIEYSNNLYPGEASITAVFKGNYAGETDVGFNILEPSIKTKTPVGITTDETTLRGVFTPDAKKIETGFYFKKYGDSGEYERIISFSSDEFEYKFKGLEPGTEYIYYAFIRIDKAEYAGDTVKFKTAPNFSEDSNNSSETGKIEIDVSNNSNKDRSMEAAIEKGNTVIASKDVFVIIGESKSIDFDELLPGYYNLVFRIEDHVETKMVYIEDGQLENVEFTITDLSKSTLVEVRDNGPDIAVNRMDEIFNFTANNGNEGITEEEFASADSIDIKVIASELVIADPENSKDKELINDIAQGQLALYFDISIVKTIKKGNDYEEINLTKLPKLLEIALPIPEEIQGKDDFVIYRVHNGSSHELTQEPNSDGEYIQIKDDHILIYAKNFSTYAIGYSDPVKVLWIIIPLAALMILFVILFVIVKKGRRKEKSIT